MGPLIKTLICGINYGAYTGRAGVKMDQCASAARHFRPQFDVTHLHLGRGSRPVPEFPEALALVQIVCI